jgi:hypothetical protein
MAMKPRDAQKLRKVFSGAGGGIKFPDVSVDGDDLEIVLEPTTQKTGVMVPYNEAGDMVFLELENSVVKRWRDDMKEANRLMRRVAAGERNTEYNNRLLDR